MTVVLNSYYFIERVFPNTISELAGRSNRSQVFDVIARSAYPILITDRDGRPSIHREYLQTLTRRHMQGFVPQLLVARQQLEAEKTVDFRRGMPRHPMPGVNARHKIFLEDAVGGNTTYLVTENTDLLRLRGNKEVCGDLEIVNGEQFVWRHTEEVANP